MDILSRWNLGQRIAPPRFVLFTLVLLAGLAVGVPALGLGRGFMVAFDVAAAVFLLSLRSLLRRNKTEQMRRAARENDANRRLLLALVGVVMLVILVAVHGELQGKNDAVAIVLVIATLSLAWLFSNTIYALHYAHLFYGDADRSGKDDGGLDFPHTPEPNYWDFIYYSFTLGMTFQTSDITTTNTHMRVVSIVQCLAAFVFNLGVLAFTINTLGGGGS